jgi:hypothetical protein
MVARLLRALPSARWLIYLASALETCCFSRGAGGSGGSGAWEERERIE